MEFDELEKYEKSISKNILVSTAVLNTRTMILNSFLREIVQNDIEICKEIFAKAPLAIYTVKDFWLLEEISEKIELFKAAGLIDLWYFQSVDKVTPISKEMMKKPKRLKLSHFQGCFIIFSIGCGFSFLVFVVEVLHKYFFKSF